MIAIVTGSREYPARWKVQDTLAQLWRELNYDLFIRVGDCPTGVDEITRSFCDSAGIPYKEYKADWEKYGKPAGPIRNHEMVDYGADLCIAFPNDKSKGTKDCASYAFSKGIEVWFPDLPAWAMWAAPIATW